MAMRHEADDKPWYRRGPTPQTAPRAEPPGGLYLIGTADVPLRVFLQRRAWDAIAAEDAERGPWGGLLIGGVYADEEGPFVVIEGALAAPADPAGGTDFRFDPLALDELEATVGSRFPGRLIVGWFHAHPGRGAGLSPLDRIVARRYFPEWWQLTYVIDPIGQRQALYYWQDGELRSLPGFWVCDEEAELAGGEGSASAAGAGRPGARGGLLALAALLLLVVWSAAPLPGSPAWLRQEVRTASVQAERLREELAAMRQRHQLLQLALLDAAAAPGAAPGGETALAPAAAKSSTASPTASAAGSPPAAPTPSLTAPPALSPAAADAPDAAAGAYVVRAGDTLWSISQRLLGDPYAYRLVAELNGIADPDYILPGWRLRLPTLDDEETP
nr:hypothetical protein [Bacillota bacterium]